MTSPSPAIRLLQPGDEARADAFLATRPDTTMILRSNLARAGLVNEGRTYQGVYAAAFVNGKIEGLAATYSNDALVLAGGDHVVALTEALAAARTRGFAATLGPAREVVLARRVASERFDAVLRRQSEEILYALTLDDLVVPPTAARLVARAPHADEMALVHAWRMRYAAETSNVVDTPETRLREHAFVDGIHEAGHDMLLFEGAIPVAYAAFNAALPEMVQVGGVFTPDELRGRGYARGVVAALLANARTRGVRRAILFTGEDNVAAQKAYAALGFQPIGDYAIASFGPPSEHASVDRGGGETAVQPNA